MTDMRLFCGYLPLDRGGTTVAPPRPRGAWKKFQGVHDNLQPPGVVHAKFGIPGLTGSGDLERTYIHTHIRNYVYYNIDYNGILKADLT